MHPQELEADDEQDEGYRAWRNEREMLREAWD
jgi:hypothetical protein